MRLEHALGSAGGLMLTLGFLTAIDARGWRRALSVCVGVLGVLAIVVGFAVLRGWI